MTTTVEDIQAAIERLDPADRARLKAWFDAAMPSPAEAKPTAQAQAAKFGRLAGQAVALFRSGLNRKP